MSVEEEVVQGKRMKQRKNMPTRWRNKKLQYHSFLLSPGLTLTLTILDI
jgi:hypothetical protein